MFTLNQFRFLFAVAVIVFSYLAFQAFKHGDKGIMLAAIIEAVFSFGLFIHSMRVKE